MVDALFARMLWIIVFLAMALGLRFALHLYMGGLG